MLFTRQLKVKFLGITPVLKDETGVLNPQEIVALSALLTFKGRSVQTLLKESIEKGQDITEKIKNILRKKFRKLRIFLNFQFDIFLDPWLKIKTIYHNL